MRLGRSTKTTAAGGVCRLAGIDPSVSAIGFLIAAALDDWIENFALDKDQALVG